jgi:hypothetical protein
LGAIPYLVAGSFAGCAPPGDAGDSLGGPLILLRVSGLDHPPGVSIGKLYQPTRFAPIDPLDPDGPPCFGFSVDVLSERPAAIEAVLSAADELRTTTFQRADLDADDDGTPRPKRDDDRTALRAGRPLYSTQALPNGETRIHFVTPRSLLTRVDRLRIFDQRASDGSPVGEVTLELARDLYYVAVVGDSVVWGNGLLEDNKFTTRVIREVERRFGVRVVMQRFAHTGASILPGRFVSECEYGCFGEVPIAYTPILRQLEQVQRPDLVELVLLDGCINDVGIDVIVDPLSDDALIPDLTRLYCHDAMRTLLQAARARFPQAWIVVTGYYPVISESSDLFGYEEFVRTQPRRAANPPRDFPANPDQLAADRAESTRQSLEFEREAHRNLREAVAETLAETPEPPIVFVDPQFGPDNTVFAPDAMLWSLRRNVRLLDRFKSLLTPPLSFFPEDQTLDRRIRLCPSRQAIQSLLICLYASVGHPNVAGASRYADRIVEELEQAGFFAP